jgi:hypothetical protein
MYALVAGNAADGTVQVLVTVPGVSAQFQLDFSIASIQGPFLGFNSIPAGTTPLLATGTATLVVTDYSNGDNADATATFCSAAVGELCVTAPKQASGNSGAVAASGEWTVMVKPKSKGSTGYDVFLELDSCTATSSSSSAIKAATFADIVFINGAAFLGTLASGARLLFLGDAASTAVDVVVLDAETSEHCLASMSVQDVTGVFLGITSKSVVKATTTQAPLATTTSPSETAAAAAAAAADAAAADAAAAAADAAAASEAAVAAAAAAVAVHVVGVR